MRGKEQVRETKFPVSRLLPRHGRSASTLPSQEVVQSASGERGLRDRADFAAGQGATSAGWGLGWDLDREKNVGRQRVVVQRRTGRFI